MDSKRHSGSAFNDWIERQRLGERKVNARLGAAVGRTQVSIHNWRKGTTLPDPAAMIAVAWLTGGEVMPNDWFPELAGDASVTDPDFAAAIAGLAA